jgi:predicted DCC family thiol-disulfide oxidoreductase YuxK
VGDESWRYLVLYDGECGLCDRSVQWLLRHDRRGVLRYAPLQGETARAFVPAGKPVETIVFVERGDDGQVRLSERSRAAFAILGRIGGPWRVLSWLRVLPAFFTDLFYRFVARNRLRWFGRVDACRLPDPAVRARFLA